MNIAYLILAHHQPAHLRRLIKVLDSDGVHFFVHVDAKADRSHFSGIEKPNVLLLKKTVRVSWAGFSQVTAMLNLIEAALATRMFDYYIFLSGVDYPIKGNTYIHNFFARHKGMTFINFYRLQGDVLGIRHLTKYHQVDLVTRAPALLSLCVRVMLRVVNAVLSERVFIKGLVPYRGSTSWCLQHDDVVYVTQFLRTKKGRELLHFLRGAFSPDEIVFPTVILNSPLAHHCRYYERDVEHVTTPLKTETRASLHYIDWDRGRENPAVFNRADFDTLRQSACLFARKFDEHVSAALLDKIDKELLQEEGVTRD